MLAAEWASVERSFAASEPSSAAITETCDVSSRSEVRWRFSFIETSSRLRSRSCVDFIM